MRVSAHVQKPATEMQPIEKEKQKYSDLQLPCKTQLKYIIEVGITSFVYGDKEVLSRK
jgi:hypothetical protein